jgi:hypothetical protein
MQSNRLSSPRGPVTHQDQDEVVEEVGGNAVVEIDSGRWRRRTNSDGGFRPSGFDSSMEEDQRNEAELVMRQGRLGAATSRWCPWWPSAASVENKRKWGEVS